jgi:hypothetical protein
VNCRVLFNGIDPPTREVTIMTFYTELTASLPQQRFLLLPAGVTVACWEFDPLMHQAFARFTARCISLYFLCLRLRCLVQTTNNSIREPLLTAPFHESAVFCQLPPHKKTAKSGIHRGLLLIDSGFLQLVCSCHPFYPVYQANRRKL